MQRLRLDLTRPFKPTQWAIAGFLWAGIALTLATQNHLRETALRIHLPWFDSFRFPIVECLFWFLVTPFLFWLARFDLMRRGWSRRALLFILANAGLVVVHAVYRLPFHRFVYPRMEPIPRATLFRLYVLGNMLNDIWVFWSIVAIAYLAMHYIRNAQRERALAHAQIQALKSQLQPHFFFNALNSISSLMREDVEAADDMITRLSDLLRVSLKTDAAQEIPLLKEIEVVQTYIDIERMRFSDRLRFSCDLGEDTVHAKVPALILLPLVENAVRHGIAQRSRPGEIRISVRRQDESLFLTIANDTGAPAGSGIVEGIGLGGTRTRLIQHYGSASSFKYQICSETGMNVQIMLPFVVDKDSALYADTRCNRG